MTVPEAAQPRALTVVLPFATVDGLLAHYVDCITEGGIYLPIEPLPVRTPVQLDLRVESGETVLRAAGQVSFVTAPGKRGHPGMGIRFTALDEQSRALVQRACAGRDTDPQLPPLPESVEMAEGEAATATWMPARPAVAPVQTPPAAALAPAASPPRPSGTHLRIALVPKAPVCLKVNVPTQATLAAQVKPAGITLTARQALPVGTTMHLEISGLLDPLPCNARGEVIAAGGGTLTVRLDDMPSGAIHRLKHVGAAGAPSSQVDLRIAVVLLADEMLVDVACELLGLQGIAAFDGSPAGLAPDVVAADAPHLSAAAKAFPHTRLVAVNLSGPDSLVGDSARAKPRAYLKRPVTGSALASAIVAQLHP